MRLPENLQVAIEEQVSAMPRSALGEAVRELTERYRRTHDQSVTVDSSLKLAAYLSVRMPATYAANLRVLREVAGRMIGVAPQSLLDLGAGPGTASWAATEVFPSLQHCVLAEHDPRMRESGKRLASFSHVEALQHASWLDEDISQKQQMQADLVIMSYSLSEVSESKQKNAVTHAWNSTRQVLIIIGPGTPRHFVIILNARDQLLSAGAHIVAPCPHERGCPMVASKDWCHFSQRLERSSDHRLLKSATLGYEDEKFSYVVASRAPSSERFARIVRHPMKRAGHVQLMLCDQTGLEQITIAKSQREQYRAARSAEWGDTWIGADER